MPTKSKSLAMLYPAALTPGMMLVLPGSTLPAIMDAFALDKPSAGYINSFFFAGALIGMLLVSDLVRIFGARAALIIASVTVGISLSCMPLADTYPLLLGVFMTAGISFGVLVTLPGVVVSGVMGESGGGAMNFVYSFFALGVMSAPMAASRLLESGRQWWVPFLMPVAPVILVAVGTAVFGLPEIEKPTGLSVRAFSKLKKHRALFTGCVVGVLLYVASEASLCFWIPKYLLDTFPDQVDIGQASRSLTWFWAGLTVGRAAATPILKRTEPATFLIAITVPGAICIAVTPHIGGVLPVLIGFTLAGAFYAAMYPTLVSYSGKLSPELAPLAFSLMTAAGQVGAITLTPAIGHAAAKMPFAWAMSLAAIPIAALALMVAILKHKKIF